MISDWWCTKRIDVKRKENTITFKIKENPLPWTPETMKLLGSTKSKITKDKNGERMSE